MKIKSKVLFAIGISCLFARPVIAQQKEKYSAIAIEKPLLIHYSKADSLINEFENSVYECIHDPKFWAKSYVPTFTILKIDIDGMGKVKDIRFSDSADSLFVKAYLNKPNYHNDRSTLEKYAKEKSYTDVSLLIPVSYEPNYSPVRSYYYKTMESIMKFDKKDFTGKAIMLKPISIKILKENNM
jgi:hypothetical protein